MRDIHDGLLAFRLSLLLLRRVSWSMFHCVHSTRNPHSTQEKERERMKRKKAENSIVQFNKFNFHYEADCAKLPNLSLRRLCHPKSYWLRRLSQFRCWLRLENENESRERWDVVARTTRGELRYKTPFSLEDNNMPCRGCCYSHWQRWRKIFM